MPGMTLSSADATHDKRPRTLDELGDNETAVVVSVHADRTAPSELLRRLSEIGFLPGERVRIVARAALGGSPIAVRVGTSTFALRRFEARCVQIAPVEPDPAP